MADWANQAKRAEILAGLEAKYALSHGGVKVCLLSSLYIVYHYRITIYLSFHLLVNSDDYKYCRVLCHRSISKLTCLII